MMPLQLLLLPLLIPLPFTTIITTTTTTANNPITASTSIITTTASFSSVLVIIDKTKLIRIINTNAIQFLLPLRV